MSTISAPINGYDNVEDKNYRIKVTEQKSTRQQHMTSETKPRVKVNQKPETGNISCLYQNSYSDIALPTVSLATLRVAADTSSLQNMCQAVPAVHAPIIVPMATAAPQGSILKHSYCAEIVAEEALRLSPFNIFEGDVASRSTPIQKPAARATLIRCWLGQGL